MRFDLMNNIHPVTAVSAGVATSDNTPIVSAIVDTLDFNSVCLIIALGTLATAAATFSVTLNAGDDPALSDAAPVPADELNGTLLEAAFDGANDGENRKLGYVGVKRYLELTITPTGNTGDVELAVLAILANAQNGPTDNPPI